MLNQMQIDRMLKKLKRFEECLEPYIFIKVDEVDFKAFVTDKQYHEIPDDSLFEPIEKGFTWQGENRYCWYKGEYTVPAELEGKPLFIKPKMEGYEAMLWVDGRVSGTFATKIVYTGHGNHYCDMIKMNPKAGEKINIAIEYYGGHHCIGCQPFEVAPIKNYNFKYEGADICVKNYEIQDFYFDLQALNQMAEALPDDSFRKGEIINCLYEVHNNVYYSIDNVDWDTFMESLRKVAPLMKQVLSVKNPESAPEAGIIGHSHMDTAWLWHIGETIKKCARTYSNALSLMEQYPEFTFIQSSACHSNMILKHYPELFERIKEKVKEGRYEPNGGVWVECDCNITSGESIVRQFLWGQRFNRKHFGYTSNCFWLPDTFGYSAAIPQIMKGCSVDYFLTTKISWNDTNVFPYDTFYWQGIDGTKVFSHFNSTHHFPNVEDVFDRVNKGVKQKSVTNKRLLAYGFGDGGGGPQFEMVEQARRIKDTLGVPKTQHVRVGDFMKELEESVKNPNVYKGELYLELHRGTLTNQHTIKRNNRKAELALRDLEILTVANAVTKGEEAKNDEINPLYEELLINQFHDILPGTCITRAHEESREKMGQVIKTAKELIAKTVDSEGEDYVTLINTLSFDRSDAVFIDRKPGCIIEGEYAQQVYTDLDGNEKLILAGLTIPAFGSVTLKWVKGEPGGRSAFEAFENKLETPFADVTFSENGAIESLYDPKAHREIVGGLPLNTFLMAEDVPSAWDNWDVDADIESKFKPSMELISREVVSDGEVAYIVRSEYRISEKSTIKQDMIFFANSAEIRFDTAMDWNDDHRFLKAAFETTITEDFARNEIQFGHVKRPTTRNNSLEQAKFEVVNHKYTDLSETKYGVSVLNDCKYGITLNGSGMYLSLHKGGTRPDEKGDKDGIHRCTYALLPHNCGFSSESVIHPAYMLNVPPVQANGKYSAKQLMTVVSPNIIVEAVKPCEDCERAFIVRFYEAEGTFTNTRAYFCEGIDKAYETNMLEEVQKELEVWANGIEMTFKPFEIKTIKVTY